MSRSAPGSDIAFLGGIVNYIFEHDAWFEEYVRALTNGPVIIKPEFRDTEDGGGFFSGWNPEHRAYGIDTWGYEGTSSETAAGQVRAAGRRVRRSGSRRPRDEAALRRAARAR